jgi:hypothetical protein
MTKLSGVVVSTLVASAVTAGVARAEEIGGLYADRMQTYYQFSVTGFENGIPSAYDDKFKPGTCARMTADAKKGGAKPGDIIRGEFAGHPKAKGAGVPFSEAAAICTAYEAQLAVALGKVAVKEMVEYMKDKKGPPTADDARGFNSGAGDGTVAKGKACLETLGKVSGATFKVAGTEMKVDDLKKTCQAAVDYGTAFNALIAEEQQAKLAEKAKKYEAAGIKGAKLKLMIEYDDVYWRNTKCEKTDDVAELAKAKVLIHWLENSDGTQTIRRYTFNGNKVSKTEKTFLTEAAAQRACR